MYLMTLLHTKNGSTANTALFYQNKFRQLVNIHCRVFPITVDTISTCMLILKLIRSTIVLLDKLTQCACAGTLQQVCYQTGCKHKKTTQLQKIVVKKDYKTTLHLLLDYVTDVGHSSILSSLQFFCSRVVFLCFYPCLVSVLFTGPSLLTCCMVHFHKKI